MKIDIKKFSLIFAAILSFVIGIFLIFVSIKSFIFREALFQANSEFPITQRDYYQTLILTMMGALILILAPIYIYFKKR